MSSRHGTHDRFGFFRNTGIGYFGNIFLRQLLENQIKSMEIDTFFYTKVKKFRLLKKLNHIRNG